MKKSIYINIQHLLVAFLEQSEQLIFCFYFVFLSQPTYSNISISNSTMRMRSCMQR